MLVNYENNWFYLFRFLFLVSSKKTIDYKWIGFWKRKMEQFSYKLIGMQIQRSSTKKQQQKQFFLNENVK